MTTVQKELIERERMDSTNNQRQQTSSSSSIWIQSKLAQLITNCTTTSMRIDIPWEDVRKPGWTETWGNSNMEEEDGASFQQQQEEEGKEDKEVFQLYQYRVAWYEQMIFQICQIPHQIINSTYYSMETTGPLPILKDFHHNAMVGRYKNENSGKHNYFYSEIVQHLSNHQLLPKTLTEHSDIPSYMLWIHTVLHQQVLQTVRFAADYEDNDNIEYSNALQVRKNYWGGRYQAWAEHITQKQVVNHTIKLQDTLELAKSSYQTLETKLSSSSDTYVLGTKEPTIVDCYLFDHLAHALTNVHLIVILANYPKLVSYFQKLYKLYLSEKPTIQTNSSNAFLQQSILSPSSNNNKKKEQKFKNAIELMQSLAIHSSNMDMNKVLKDVKKQRQVQETILSKNQQLQPFRTFHRLLHGGDMYPTKDEEEEEDEMTRKTKEQMKKLKRQSETQDQMWISGVVVITAITLFMSTLNQGS